MFFPVAANKHLSASCQRQRRGLLVLISLALLAPGCVSPERLANRLIAAPNLQAHFFSDKQLDYWCKSALGTNNPLSRQMIPVGPPDAKLSVMELPPADYHVKVWSKVSKLNNGKKELALGWTCTNIAATPLEQKGTVVLLHGYLTQKETMLPWAVVLAQSGYRVVLVDLRGHGNSTGRTFSGGKYETADLMQVMDYLTAQKLCDLQVGVLGYSFGADLALYWAARDPRVKTVVAIAAYNKPDEAVPRLAKDLKLPFSQEKVRQAATIAEAKLGIKWSDWTGEAAIRRIHEPIFFIGAGKDTISPPEDLELFKQIAPPGSKSQLVPEANHEAIAFWLHDLAVPVKSWFQEHLPAGK
jgi:pimeloyl-ACP methyl ester carboxylesterase